MSSLTSLVNPTSVVSFGENFCKYCWALSSVVLPTSLSSVGSMSFYSSGLHEISIPSSISALGASTFGNCQWLTMISLPSTLTSLGASVLNNCVSLKSVLLPSSLVVIGADAFVEMNLAPCNSQNSTLFVPSTMQNSNLHRLA